MLNLSGGVVTAGKEWTDEGAAHEVHSLKRRAVKATRPVPIPPPFAHTLRKHADRFGVAPDGRVFRNAAGGYVDAAGYGKLFRSYAKFLDSLQEHSHRLVKEPMQNWSRRSEDSSPRAEPPSGPCMARNRWSGLGYRRDERDEGGISAPPPWEGRALQKGA
ncbi:MULTISPECIES: hypothetical protein [unclassified Streptomyces]|uniref:hypothetical protein n=1 Tax=unclassified Streptomyces TaxID=2593676 RepID=UPI001F107776|nr:MULTISPECIES: hypothetical protein [unclassified Streptomyces]